MKLNIYLLATLLFLFEQTSFSQVAGKVIDEKYNLIEGAIITHKKQNIHTHSDENGRFSININIGDTLVIEHFLFEDISYIHNIQNGIISIFLKERAFLLKNVTISSKRSPYESLAKIDNIANPINNAQEVLRQVPGLIIGQHAGGGKAEQIFLRGFDIDHGTDIKIDVDGLPVNMVSHAHGQGYADLHFIIPEVLDDMEYGKGPYNTEKGNFTTAGYISFKTKEKLKNSFISTELGNFNTRRNLLLVNVSNQANTKTNGYVAGEYLLTDGPFDAKQSFNRLNLFSKFSHNLSENEKITVFASHFTSQWDASGQIPQRAVDTGLIGRFGAIDSTEGGKTSRQNLSLIYQKYLNKNTSLKSQFYYSKYDFELFSNFTFFFRDPINGDQIKQKESRNITGFNISLFNESNFEKILFTHRFTAGFRNDDIKENELSYTKNRKTLLERVSYGDVSENNLFTTFNSEFNYKNLSFDIGARFDYFSFNYKDYLPQNYSNLQSNESIISPKFSLQYEISDRLNFYSKIGRGFHSNDTRVILSGTVQNSLPKATGIDIGMNTKPLDFIMLNLAVWQLNLQQEFVYVGDEGIVEAGGRTKRRGIDACIRLSPLPYLFFFMDANFAKARSVEELEGNNYIPLAPIFTNSSGLTYTKNGFVISLKYRSISDRPANEDYSITAKGYTVFDGNVSYEYKNFLFGIDANNLFNTSWNETQFATESRLIDENVSTEEIHFTPGSPLFMKAKIGYKF